LAPDSVQPFRKKTSEQASGPDSRLVCWVALVALFLVVLVVRRLALVF
jgi:hypothetical protein